MSFIRPLKIACLHSLGSWAIFLAFTRLRLAGKMIIYARLRQHFHHTYLSILVWHHLTALFSYNNKSLTRALVRRLNLMIKCSFFRYCRDNLFLKYFASHLLVGIRYRLIFLHDGKS